MMAPETKPPVSWWRVQEAEGPSNVPGHSASAQDMWLGHHLKADDAAKAAKHLVDGDVMVDMGGQARVVHTRNARMLLQPPRQFHCRLHPAQQP